MRRILLGVTVLALMGLTTAALAEYGPQNYKDKFDTGGYSGNDGSLDWSGPWKEVGESDGPESGKVRVEGSGCSGQCLTIDSGLLDLGAGAYRLADTGEFSYAKLSYLVDFDGGLLGLLEASLTVAATSNGGGSWTPVDSIALGSGGAQSRTVDVSGFRDDQFGVRFTVTGAAGAEVIIDDVKVYGEIPEPTTTTTTSTTTTTTTTLPKLTTTTLPKLTTTLPILTTTTTRPTTTTTTSTTTTTTAPTTVGGDDGGATTTTTPDPTTTLAAGGGGGGPDDPGPGPGNGDGIRQTEGGLTQSDFDRELFGDAPEVLGFAIDTGFSDAVELIEASWIWVLALALLIAGAVVKGIDRKIAPAPPIAIQES